MVAVQTLTAGPEPEAARPTLRLIQGGGVSRREQEQLYRRRRVAAFACALVLVVGAWAGVLGGLRLLVGGPGGGPLTAPAATPPQAPIPPGATVHVVEPGETVWDIARAVTPSGDVRATVHRIIERNGGSAVQPGQRLVITY